MRPGLACVCVNAADRLRDDRQRFGELDAARRFHGLGIGSGGVVPISREQVLLAEDDAGRDDAAEDEKRDDEFEAASRRASLRLAGRRRCDGRRIELE